MGAFDGETLADRFRNHFGHTDHLYGALLAEMGAALTVDSLPGKGTTAIVSLPRVEER